jgi:hypothetical protein
MNHTNQINRNKDKNTEGGVLFLEHLLFKIVFLYKE